MNKQFKRKILNEVRPIFIYAMLCSGFCFCETAIATQVDALQKKISINFIPPDIQAYEPGQVLFISALLENVTVDDVNVQIGFDLPEEWTVLSEDTSSFVLLSKENQVYLNAIQIPQKTLPGIYNIRMFAKSENGEISAFDLMSVRVSCFQSLKADVEKIPILLTHQEGFSVLLRYSNEGNTDLPLRVELSANPPCEMITESYSIFLSPSEEKVDEIFAIAKTSCLAKRESSYIFLKIWNSETQELLYNRTVIFDVLSEGGICVDPYLRIPATFRVVAVKQVDEEFGFIEYQGAGIIDPEREIASQFMLRLPLYTHHIDNYDVKVKSFYGNFDSPDWELTLGDAVYSISPLAEAYWYSRGAMVNIYRDRWEGGVFYGQDVLNEYCQRREVGTFLSLQVNEKVRVGGTYLNKQIHRSRYHQAHIGELDIELNPFPCLMIETNIANNFQYDRGNDHTGYRVAVSGNRCEDYSFLLERIYIGKLLGGYYNHLNQSTIAFERTLNDNFSTNFGYSTLQYFSDCRCNCNFKFATRAMQQRSYQGQLNYFNNRGFSSALTAFYFEAKDLFKHSKFNFRQYWGGFNIGQARSNYFLSAITSFGVEENLRHKHKTCFLQRYNFNLNYNFSSEIYSTVFIEFGNINLLNACKWRYAFGGQLYYRFNCQTWLQGLVQVNRFTRIGRWNNQYALQFEHMFSNRHLLNLSVQQLHYPQDMHCNELQFLVSYVIPFDLKVGRRKDIGAVQGVIYNEKDGNPVPNAIVCVDEMAVLTDQQGSFVFQGLMPGCHQFKTEKLPQNHISDFTDPLFIDVKGGQTACIDIPVYQSSRVQGYLLAFDYPDVHQIDPQLFQEMEQSTSLPLINERGLEGIQVILTNEQTQKALSSWTDSCGYFEFIDLCPGIWCADVNPGFIPKGFFIQNNHFYIDVKENQIHEIRLETVPSTLKEISFEEG